VELAAPNSRERVRRRRWWRRRGAELPVGRAPGDEKKKGRGKEGVFLLLQARPDEVLYSLIRAQRSPREARFYSREILRFRAKQNRKTRKLVFREDLDARIRICVWYTAFRMTTRNDDERLSRKLGSRYRCVIRALLSVNMKVWTSNVSIPFPSISDRDEDRDGEAERSEKR